MFTRNYLINNEKETQEQTNGKFLYSYLQFQKNIGVLKNGTQNNQERCDSDSKVSKFCEIKEQYIFEGQNCYWQHRERKF
jgi:hypothetical protein